MTEISLVVNGRAVKGQAEGRVLLVQFLRETLGLTGTHVGCDTSQCGACVVHVDGRAVKSCTMLAAQADGSQITTIEGIARGQDLHPVQAAFREHHGLQCGYCTPGMIMTAVDMIRRHDGVLDEKTVRDELDGNICRCTGYHNIVKAVLAAAEAMRAEPADQHAGAEVHPRAHRGIARRAIGRRGLHDLRGVVLRHVDRVGLRGLDVHGLLRRCRGRLLLLGGQIARRRHLSRLSDGAR